MLQTLGISRKETVGLALSGGGARGFAHIGVFMAFERFNIIPDIISGVSAGSIAATLYASGLTPLEMIDCFSEYNKFGDYTEFSIPKSGFFKLSRFGKLLESWLRVTKLEDLKIPTVVCATDIDHGKSIGWAKGDILPRVLASCSIPVIFNPVKINGINYVDGGVLRNLPAWAIREHCKTLIGSNCSPLNRNYRFKDSIVDISLRTFQLMTKSNSLQDIKLCDHVIQSEGMSRFKTFGISEMKKIISAGYDDACKVLETIAK